MRIRLTIMKRSIENQLPSFSDHWQLTDHYDRNFSIQRSRFQSLRRICNLTSWQMISDCMILMSCVVSVKETFRTTEWRPFPSIAPLEVVSPMISFTFRSYSALNRIYVETAHRNFSSWRILKLEISRSDNCNKRDVDDRSSYGADTDQDTLVRNFCSFSSLIWSRSPFLYNVLLSHG